jgi:hypothetical protein
MVSMESLPNLVANPLCEQSSFVRRTRNTALSLSLCSAAVVRFGSDSYTRWPVCLTCSASASQEKYPRTGIA